MVVGLKEGNGKAILKVESEKKKKNKQRRSQKGGQV